MAADQTLVEGAYRAARAGVEADIAGLKAKTDIISSATKGVTDVIGAVQAEEQKYYEYVQKIIDNAGSLDQEDASLLYDNLEEGKKGFIWGSKKDKALIIRNLTKKANAYKDWEDVRFNIAENSDEKNIEGFSSSFSKEDRLALMSGQLVEKRCEEGVEYCPDEGDMGIMFNGEWTSLPSIKTIIEKNKVDTEFKKNINALADDFSTRSKNIPEGQVGNLPEGEAKRKISGLLETAKTTGNIKSVARDRMFGETSWYEDAVEKAKQLNWEGLGITEEQLMAADINGEPGIQDDEAIGIIEAIMEDGDKLTEELNEYYFGFVKQNWNHGEEGRARTAAGYELRTGKYRKIQPEENNDFNNYEGPLSLQEQLVKINEEFELGNITEEERDKMIIEANKKDIAP